MNSLLTTLERPASPLAITPVLARNGFDCATIALEAGAESVLPAGHSNDDQLLFVLNGELAVQHDGITTLVNPGEATLVAPGASPVLSSPSGAPVSVLRVMIPPRRVVMPQIITPRT
ncbi:MAG TPA: hypothetical protein VHN79_08715 [Lacunisphaera sp.]|nr:hypothetical protein [Lacunisphaera sp.]